MRDYPILTGLLGLANVRVTHYQFVGASRMNVFVASTLEAAICPDCQQVSVDVHDVGQPQMIRDLPIWGRRCWLVYAPRRFKCSRCDNTFVERVVWREPGFDYTTRYEQAIYERTRREPIAQIAQDQGLSEDIVQGIFERWAKKTIAQRGYPRVKVLCLDEIAPHKGHGRYRLVISAPELGIVLDVLKDHLKDTLAAWFDGRGRDWCAGVQVCCADMWEPYHDVGQAKLPHARLVVDRFHIMKNLNEAISKTRRVIQNHADVHTKAILKGCRWLLVKNRENLSAEEGQKLQVMLAASPELKTCYELKEAFGDWFKQSPDRKTAATTLQEWITRIEASGLRALQTFVKTLNNWRERILNYFDGRHSNGFAEGINLKIKMINRRGYGYSNFAHFRLHVLVAFDPVSR